MIHTMGFLFKSIVLKKLTIKKAALLIAALPVMFFVIASIHGLIDSRLKIYRPSDLLIDRSYTFIAALENDYGEFGFWTISDTLPENLRLATFAAEDRRFGNHFGIDIHAAGRAFVNNYIRKNSYSGASTIAMQVARLQHGGNSGWYFKIHDAVSAVCLTLFYGRERVLKQYFTIAPYGNRISGAACASQRYFQKPLRDISFAEASLLAALPKAPSRMNLFYDKGFSLAKKRAALIITRTCTYGWISKQVRDETLAELASFRKPSKQIRSELNYHYVNAVRKHFTSSQNGGIQRTTLDNALQDSVMAIIDKRYYKLYELYAKNISAMVIDIKTGHVLSYIGSIDYDSPQGGAIDCAALPRSTGSLLKPFIYAMGLEWLGYTSSTILTDLGFDFGTGRNSFIPENFDRKFQGPVLYKNALANSRNIPSIEVLKALGVPMFYDKCIALGLTENNGLANYYGLGLSIGGLYCSLQQICEAYLCLADNGRKRKLVWNYSDNEDSSMLQRQIIEPDIAQQIKRYLSDPVARLPSFPRGGNMEYPFAVAVKTGTSEGYRDSWCCAISDKYVVGVWVGNTDFSQTKNLSGYEGSAAVVKHIMMYLHKDKAGGLNDIQFNPPERYIPVEICKLTGKKADKFTPYTTTEYFKPGTEPVEFSTVQQLVAVDKRNKLPLTPGCTAPSELHRFIVLDAQYQEWARSQGLEILPDRFSPYCSDNTIVDNYEIKIVSPKSNSRFFIDPEMPDGTSVMKIKCSVKPSPKSVLWFVNDEEYMETAYPYQLSLKMQKGKYSLFAKITGTDIRSERITIEIF